MGYSQFAWLGVRWQGLLKILTAVIVLGKVMVLSRLLGESDFGLFSLVVIGLGIGEAFTQTGINLTILQSPRSVAYFVNTAWVVAMVRGALIGVAILLMGLIVAQVYQQPVLVVLYGLAALVPLIKGAINPSIVSLQKNLNFPAESAYRLFLVVTDAVMAILGAWWWGSVMGLVAGMIAAAVAEVVVSQVFFSPRPRWQYQLAVARDIFASMPGLNLSALLNYLNENLDDALVGKIAGPAVLGLYHQSYAIGHKVNYDFAQVVHASTLPIYTKVVTEPARLWRAFAKTAGVTALTLGVLSLPVLLLPELAVRVVLGEKWLAIVPAVPWLVAAGWVQSVVLTTYSLFLAEKRYRLMNLHTLLSVISLVVGVTVGTHSAGLLGASTGLLASRVLCFPIVVYGVWGSWRRAQTRGNSI